VLPFPWRYQARCPIFACVVLGLSTVHCTHEVVSGLSSRRPCSALRQIQDSQRSSSSPATFIIPSATHYTLVFSRVLFRCSMPSMKVREAKDFLVQQAVEQAALEHIPFSDLEKRMM
jgi:hypothetical protein